MKNFIQKLKNKTKREDGASSTIEFLFAMSFLLLITITIIDSGIYFANRNIITNSTQNGARLVSLYGGVGGSDKKGTPINQRYGNATVSGCSAAGNSNPVACNVENELKRAPLVNVQVQSITCGPSKTGKLGERTWCEVSWNYPGLPGSARTLIARNSENTKTIMSAESEVIVK